MISNQLGPFPTQVLSGGIDSVYGIGQTNTSRFVNTFQAASKTVVIQSQNLIPFKVGAAIPSVPITFTTSGLLKINPYSPFDDGNNKLVVADKQHERTYGKALVDARSVDFGQADSLSEFGVTTPEFPQENSTLEEGIEEKIKIGIHSQDLYTSDGLDPAINDIADYNMLTYTKIQELAKDRKDNGTTTDFRKKLLPSSRGNLNSTDYTTENIENTNKFGFGNPGKLSDKRNNQFGVDFSKLKDFTGHYDEVQVKKIGDTDASLDIVPLIFQVGSSSTNALQFRGTISGLTENFSPSYNEIKYSGRAEPVYVYESFKRDISFGFKVYATSRVEMQPLWTKLERLSTYTMPTYATGGYTAPGSSELKLTIGKLYVNTPMILTTLSYTYSDETPWDIDFGTPMGIDVQVGCTILGNSLHKYKSEEVYAFDGTFRV